MGVRQRAIIIEGGVAASAFREQSHNAYLRTPSFPRKRESIEPQANLDPRVASLAEASRLVARAAGFQSRPVLQRSALGRMRHIPGIGLLSLNSTKPRIRR
jgi:hypothetical protein